MKFLQFLKRTKGIIISLFVILLFIVFCSILSLNGMSGFSQIIHYTQVNLMAHKTALILSHILVFGAIFFMGFFGFKNTAQKKNIPSKQIKAFAYLMLCFLLTIFIIDLVTLLS